jgi:hypothetical protein
VYEKNIVVYKFPTYKYNKKYIKVDKLGKITAIKKVKSITIGIKYYSRTYKVKLKVKA